MLLSSTCSMCFSVAKAVSGFWKMFNGKRSVYCEPSWEPSLCYLFVDFRIQLLSFFTLFFVSRKTETKKFAERVFSFCIPFHHLLLISRYDYLSWNLLNKIRERLVEGSIIVITSRVISSRRCCHCYHFFLPPPLWFSSPSGRDRCRQKH